MKLCIQIVQVTSNSPWWLFFCCWIWWCHTKNGDWKCTSKKIPKKSALQWLATPSPHQICFGRFRLLWKMVLRAGEKNYLHQIKIFYPRKYLNIITLKGFNQFFRIMTFEMPIFSLFFQVSVTFKLQKKYTYVGHFLGIAYPSRPGFSGMSFRKLRHERHCMDIFVALARMAEAAITIPGIFTRRDICSDWSGQSLLLISQLRCRVQVFFEFDQPLSALHRIEFHWSSSQDVFKIHWTCPASPANFVNPEH